MTYLSLGQYTIPIAWIAFFVAIIYSDFRIKNANERTIALVSRVFWVYILTWKFSYLLFSFDSFMQAPLSVIYFDGGFNGHLLAIAVSSVLIVQKWHSIDVDTMIKYWVRVVAVSQLVTFLFSTQWLLAIVWFLVLLAIELRWSNLIVALQWGILLWLQGFIDPYVFIQAIVLLYLMVKEKRIVAITIITTLMAFMLTDIEKNTESVVRQPIDLMTTDGERYILQDKPQNVTVVNFFATWCPPCQAEMPHLQNFAEHIPSGVEIIGVNLTARDNGSKELQQFMNKYEVTYPILLDEKDVYGKGYEVLSIPTTIIVDEKGAELQRIVGPVSEHQLRNIIELYN